jgi:hypothetical protein
MQHLQPSKMSQAHVPAYFYANRLNLHIVAEHQLSKAFEEELE